MSGLVEVTGPAIEPVTRAEVKSQLRLDVDDDNILIDSLIKTARIWAENYTGRMFIQRTLQQFLDSAYQADVPLWEGTRVGPYQTHFSNYIELEPTPVSAVTSIRYFDDNDSASTWATSNYYVDTVGEPARVILRDGGSYPTDTRTLNSIEVNITAGYGTATTDVPEAIRMAILQYITFMYENRGEFDGSSHKPPMIIQNLLNPYKVLRFGGTSYNKMFKTGIG